MKNNKSGALLEQMQGLMKQHAAGIPPAPAPQPALRPQPAAVQTAPPTVPQATASHRPQTGRRFGAQFTVAESQKLDDVALEAHQRLGIRISVTDVVRIGLARIGPGAPITAEEIAALRAVDRRRTRSAG